MSFEPRFTVSQPITSALTRIERARGFLEAAKLSEDWIREMRARAFVIEAHSTTHIEGSTLTLAQSERLLAGKRVRGGVSAPGAYRKVQNYVVNSRTRAIIYTPPPAREVAILMADLVAWIGNQRELNAVLLAGIAQFQLVHIHPFLDGNGRTARLLSTLWPYRSGYDFKRLFSISEYYDRDRPAYYGAIQSVRERGMDLTGWLEYFAEGLAAQMSEVRDRGERVIRRDVVLGRARQSGVKDRPLRVLAFLLDHRSAQVAELEADWVRTGARSSAISSSSSNEGSFERSARDRATPPSDTSPCPSGSRRGSPPCCDKL